MSDEIPIGPNRCHYCGGEYGEHQDDCANKKPKERRFKDHDWATIHTNKNLERWQEAQINLLMDIRDELKEIKLLLTKDPPQVINPS